VFLSSLADNGLLIAAIDLLNYRNDASWMTPALRITFYLSYVLVGPFVGAISDALPKSRIIFLANFVKIAGCGLLLIGVQPLVAYGLVGLGVAAYSPAKYGILPELLADGDLVAGNAWIEAVTVASILLGVGLGSLLVNPTMTTIGSSDIPVHNAIGMLGFVYAGASIFAAIIPRGIARDPSALNSPCSLLQEFHQSFWLLWRDHDSQISLAVTCLFWAASATLQFLILRWGTEALALDLSHGALLQTAVAVGMIVGAAAAARWIPLKRALTVLPTGIGIAVAVVGITFLTHISLAALLLAVIGALSGLLLIPMNALLQHRGQILLKSGQAIAVQNFNESLASLVLLAVYSILVYLGAPLIPTIDALGLLLLVAILLLAKQRRTTRQTA
jgi:MFS family permease